MFADSPGVEHVVVFVRHYADTVDSDFSVGVRNGGGVEFTCSANPKRISVSHQGAFNAAAVKDSNVEVGK